jgi:hypothetical protein
MTDDLVKRLRDKVEASRIYDDDEELLDEAADRIEKLEAALRCCGELFSDIRNDWSDPRSECREGWRVIEEALEGKDD